MLALALRLGSGTPVGAYLALEVRRQFRNRRFVFFTLGFPVVLYVLYTAILHNPDSLRIGGLSWSVYFLVSMAAYGAIAASMSQANPIAAERTSGWTRHLRVTPLPGPGYIVTKLATALCLTLPALALVSIAGVVVNHVGLSIRTWVELIPVLAIGSLPFAALGILIGYVFDVDSAQGAMVVMFFVNAILGGLFAPVESFPSALATIAYVLPGYHFAELGRQIVAGQLPDAIDVAVLAAYTVILGGLAAWRYIVSEQQARA